MPETIYTPAVEGARQVPRQGIRPGFHAERPGRRHAPGRPPCRLFDAPGTILPGIATMHEFNLRYDVHTSPPTSSPYRA